jgi:hypothetical protein
MVLFIKSLTVLTETTLFTKFGLVRANVCFMIAVPDLERVREDEKESRGRRGRSGRDKGEEEGRGKGEEFGLVRRVCLVSDLKRAREEMGGRRREVERKEEEGEERGKRGEALQHILTNNWGSSSFLAD